MTEVYLSTVKWSDMSTAHRAVCGDCAWSEASISGVEISQVAKIHLREHGGGTMVHKHWRMKVDA